VGYGLGAHGSRLSVHGFKVHDFGFRVCTSLASSSYRVKGGLATAGGGGAADLERLRRARDFGISEPYELPSATRNSLKRVWRRGS
jgi:hypothetical protein